ncbi:MAG: threonine/serine ThrE exporter family protein [Myxococcota bacterium]
MVEGWFAQGHRMLRPLRLEGIRADSSLDRVVGDPATDDPTFPELHTAVDFTTKLARALLGYGLPVYRLEEALDRLTRSLGFDASFYLTPTGMIATFELAGERHTQVVVASPGTVDMERLGALHALVGRVERGELSPADGSQRIDAILARPPRYGPGLTVLAAGLLSAAVALLLGGSTNEMAWAGVLGLAVGLVGRFGQRSITIGRLVAVLASLFASLAAFGLAATGMTIQPPLVLIAAVITLVPGLTLTIALVELATGNLVSGTARLMGAMVTFLQLGFGPALGHALSKVLPLELLPAVGALPEWTFAFAPLVATGSFIVLLRVRMRDALWVLLSCSLAVAGSRLGGHALGPEVGAFVGAILVGLFSHGYAWRTDRPSLVLLVPGILMLVPGIIGFLSLNSLLEDDPVVALQTGFDMLLIGMAVATGILVATLAVPLRRSL